MQLPTFTTTGKKGTLTASDAIFAEPVNSTLISQAVRVYLSNARQGTSKVKTRSEVTGSRRKIYKQKGTGGARHAARSAPIFVGGGVTHGPTGNQNWHLTLTKKLKQKALISALSWQKDSITVIDEVESISGKTKDMIKLLTTVNPKLQRVLVIVPKQIPAVERAISNLRGVAVMEARQVNALDICSAEAIVMTTASVQVLEKRLAKDAAEKSDESKVKAVKPVAPKAVKTKKKPVEKVAKKAAPKAKAVAKPKKAVTKK